MDGYDYKKNGPLVSVLLATYNRRRFLPEALASIVGQDYRNLEIFVMNDGGEDVSDIIESFNDPRIIFIDGEENKGLPFRLNQALERARGKYVCYLGDDDIFYPHHISTLVDILERQSDCQVAYSDLYKVYCRIEPDGSREVLSKIVEISRDFDRFFMFYFNHVLHVSLMHRRDLIEKAGPYNEELSVLVDWDLTKRLAFYTDFYHTNEITGEFYAPVNKSDRISVRQRKDKSKYTRNVMMIRTTRPPKPWPKVKDMSIIVTAEVFDQLAGDTVGLIWRHTFYPYEVYVVLPESEWGKINTEMPNLVFVPTQRRVSVDAQVDEALKRCEGEYIVIVPRGYPVGEMWVENSLYAMVNDPNREGVLLEGARDDCWAVVVRRDVLMRARSQYKELSVRQSLARLGCRFKKIELEEKPFLFDELYNEGKFYEGEGDWTAAARAYECAARRFRNELWMYSLAARAFYYAGNDKKAMEHSRFVNERRPTVDTLLIEAKLYRRMGDYEKAVEILECAREILGTGKCEWKQLNRTVG